MFVVLKSLHKKAHLIERALRVTDDCECIEEDGRVIVYDVMMVNKGGIRKKRHLVLNTETGEFGRRKVRVKNKKAKYVAKIIAKENELWR